MGSVNVGHVSSTESKSCVICGKKTGTYKVYEQTNISIKIPACGNGCFDKVNINNFADLAIKLVKKAIEK